MNALHEMRSIFTFIVSSAEKAQMHIVGVENTNPREHALTSSVKEELDMQKMRSESAVGTLLKMSVSPLHASVSHKVAVVGGYFAVRIQQKRESIEELFSVRPVFFWCGQV